MHILLCRNAAAFSSPRSLIHSVISYSAFGLSLYVCNRAFHLYFTSSRLHHLLSVTMLSSIHHPEYFTQDAAKCDHCVWHTATLKCHFISSKSAKVCDLYLKDILSKVIHSLMFANKEQVRENHARVSQYNFQHLDTALLPTRVSSLEHLSSC